MRDPALAHRLVCSWHMVVLKLTVRRGSDPNLALGVKHIDVPFAPWKIWKILSDKGISE
jgi:hypothetical protein